MPLKESTLGCNVLYWEGQVYPIQLCNLKMTFSSCVQYLSCYREEVLMCTVFWMVVDCCWEPVIEQHYLHCRRFWENCKNCKERACLSSGSWQCGLLLEVKDNWLPCLRCPDKASKEDSCPAGMACQTLTLGEVCCTSFTLEMDSYKRVYFNISSNSSFHVVCAKKIKLKKFHHVNNLLI